MKDLNEIHLLLKSRYLMNMWVSQWNRRAYEHYSKELPEHITLMFEELPGHPIIAIQETIQLLEEFSSDLNDLWIATFFTIRELKKIR